jgi:hypothetical protein
LSPSLLPAFTGYRHYYGSIRPLNPHWYFRPHGWFHLCFSLFIGYEGSHVPYKCLCKAPATYMPVDL